MSHAGYKIIDMSSSRACFIVLIAAALAACSEGVGLATTLKPSPGVTVVVLTFSPKGHNAVAIHKDVPGLVCAIWAGSHSRPLDDPSKEGAPSCRLPG